MGSDPGVKPGTSSAAVAHDTAAAPRSVKSEHTYPAHEVPVAGVGEGCELAVDVAHARARHVQHAPAALPQLHRTTTQHITYNQTSFLAAYEYLGSTEVILNKERKFQIVYFIYLFTLHAH